MSNDKVEILIQNRASLSKKQRQLLDYMLRHINQMTDTTVDEVAKQSGVGKATIFRMLREQGYSSFVALKLEIGRYVGQTTPSAYWQVQRMLSTGEHTSNALSEVLEYTAMALDMFEEKALEEAFNRVVDLMVQAPHVGVMGCRTSNLAAQYFEALMLPASQGVTALSVGEHFMMDRILKMPKGTIIFALARWPYMGLTIKAMEYAHDLGYPVVLLTNDEGNEASTFATEILVTPRVEDRYSIVPFIVMIEALVNEIFARTSKDTLVQLGHISNALEQYELLAWQK